ncbi:MAG: hypothetical protein K8I03_02480 [Ignavibacteria bacterium]|nr:hypothetical protein [Ignavibacteria bacterium]
MTKPFNKSLNADINLLKNVKVAEDSAEYKDFFNRIMKKHGISRTTMFVELAKDTPGSYKKHDHSGRKFPITKKEAEMVKELLFKRKSQSFICKAMSNELGFNYTLRRLAKAKGEIIALGNPHDPKGIPATKFQGNIRRLFHKFAELDLSNPNQVYWINFEGVETPFTSTFIKETMDRAAAFAAAAKSGINPAGGMTLEDIYRYDMQTILLDELRQIKNGRYASPRDIKNLDAIRRSLAQSNQTAGYTLDDVLRAVQHYAPSATKDDVSLLLSRAA